jgi:hypothetical protein
VSGREPKLTHLGNVGEQGGKSWGHFRFGVGLPNRWSNQVLAGDPWWLPHVNDEPLVPSTHAGTLELGRVPKSKAHGVDKLLGHIRCTGIEVLE